MDCFTLLEKVGVFFQEVAFMILYRHVVFDYFFHFNHRLYLILKLYILLSQNSCIHPIKKDLIVETSLDLLYLAILFLLSSCYLLLLSNQNQSAYLFLFHIPSLNILDKEKNISQW